MILLSWKVYFQWWVYGHFCTKRRWVIPQGCVIFAFSYGWRGCRTVPAIHFPRTRLGVCGVWIDNGN